MTNLEEATIDIGSIQELVLSTLQKSKEPLFLEGLVLSVSQKVIGATKESVVQSINTLITEGYDIKELVRGRTKLITLVRHYEMTEDDMYRIHGQIKTPLLITSDWHVGSKGFYKIAYTKLRKDIEEYSIQDTVIAGDVLQGRGVYATELSELLIPDLTGQIDLAQDLLNELECTVHMVQGNHEEKIQGSVHVGLDALKLVAGGCSNVTYYGHVANLMLNERYRYTMMHGSGAVTAASTHMIEKVWRELVMKPNILQMGHNHQMDYVRKGHNRIGLNSGTLQRTNAWLIQKGNTAKIGWWILEDIDDEAIKLIDRQPKLN